MHARATLSKMESILAGEVLRKYARIVFESDKCL
jgi:hypothetical protein